MLSRRALYAGIGIGAAITTGWYAVAGDDDWSGSLGLGLFYAIVVGFVVVVDRVSEWMLVLIWEIDASRTVQARLAVAEERLRFARDFHDVLGRNLTLIAVTSDLAAGLARRGDPDAVDKMLQVRSIAHESAREVREVVTGYRAADLDTELAGARSVLRAAGITTRVIGDSTCIPADAQTAFAWVLREATTNVIRHSNATTCTIELGIHPRTEAGAADTAVLRIRNDGAPPLDPFHPPGHGLAGLRERVTALGGHLAAGPEPGGWFTVEARLPADHTTPPRTRRGPGPGPVIRLLLADDEHLIRTALAALLGMQDDLDVVAQAASGPEAVAMARRHHPDVAVLDLQMPGLDGITVAEQLHTQLPDCATLIVTSHGRPGHLKRALAAGVRRVPAQNRLRAGPRRRRPHRSRRRTVRRPPTRRRGHQHRRQPTHQPGDRRPGTRRRRHPDRGHRPAGRTVPRHRPQLPLLRRHQTRRRQPARSRPTRPHPRLDLISLFTHPRPGPSIAAALTTSPPCRGLSVQVEPAMTMSRMVVTTSAGSLISGMKESLDAVMCRPRGDSAANCCCRATYVAACAGDVVSPAVLLLLTTVRGTSGNGAACAISVAVCGRNRSSAFRRDDPDDREMPARATDRGMNRTTRSSRSSSGWFDASRTTPTTSCGNLRA